MGAQIWYKDWFNSPYYHILYKNRDYSEAGFFLDNLIKHLHIPNGSRIWDNACGKGRHAIYLNKKGMSVTGTDLSENSIAEALRNQTEGLEFYVHDMRHPFRVNYFQYVLNVFTSIGYFENANDNFKVFKQVYSALKPGGIFVIDFFNAKKVCDKINTDETKNIDGITFHITKKISDNKISKRIEFADNGNSCFFEEKVSLLTLNDFTNMGNATGLKLVETFGSYGLEKFNENNSDRLILIFKK